jgi:methyl-accepting chemotaxis protein
LISQADASVKETKDKVDQGERSITSLDGRFITLMESVSTLTDTLDHLKSVSENQLEGSKSIELSIDNVSKLTQSNTSMAQEIAASCQEQVAITESLSQASEEASSMAEHLNNLISKFKL